MVDNLENKADEQLSRVLGVIAELKSTFRLKANNPDETPLFYCGVADSNIMEALTPVVEKYFGPPYKAGGQSAVLRNLFDHFVRQVGGIRRDQTLYRFDAGQGLQVFCAFWPWGSNPVKTSIRIGLLHDGSESAIGRSRNHLDAFR